MFFSIRKNSTSLSLLGVLVIFSGLFYLSHESYQESKTRAREALGRELLSIAQSVGAGIDGDAFEALFTLPEGQAASPESRRAFYESREFDPRYRKIRAYLERQIKALEHRGFTEKNMYIFAPDALDPENEVRWAIMAHSKSFTGEPYAIPAAMRPVLQGSRPFAVTDLYLSTASNLRWMSAFAPLRNRAGQVVGIVDVALEVEQVLEETHAARRNLQLLILMIIAAGLAATLALVAFVLRLKKTNDDLKGEIEKREKAQALLLHNAYYDHLTGLPNRLLFQEHLARTWTRAAEADGPRFAVIYLALDRFKKINDSLGFTIGDDLLIAASHRISDCLREGQILARPSGGNFAILLNEFETDEEVLALAEHIRVSLADNFLIQGHEIFVTASLGVAFFASQPENGNPGAGEEGNSEKTDDPDTYLRYAETAMNRARDAGGGRCVIFSDDMHVQAVNLLQTATDLRQAVERDEFIPFYQPIISLDSGKIAGFEALVRWRHPRRGLVSPAEFIPLAEETGLIDEIGLLILEKSCAQLSEWKRAGHRHLYMAVNFSPHQFRDRRLPHIVQDALKRFGISRFDFKMEITESSAMEEIEHTDSIFGELREMGILMSIDDFGTGYSSLAYLSRMPIHTLKIDKSFLDELTDPPGDGNIIRTIVNLSHGLYLNVVAEGVETPEQLEFLHRIGCDEIQGYLISKPLPAPEVERLGIGKKLLARSDLQANP